VPSCESTIDSTFSSNALADPAPPRIRILDDMLRLLLGGLASKKVSD
jgi:hypothetical protein